MAEPSGRSGPLRRVAPFALIAVVLLLLVFRAKPGGEEEPYRAETRVMGSGAHLILLPGPEMSVPPERAAELAFDAMREVERTMSRFDPKSDIGRLNAAAPGTWVAVSPLTWRATMEALRMHRLTGGAFDPTVGPLVELYSPLYKAAPGTARMPADEAIEAARARIGGDRLGFDRDGMRLSFPDAGMRLDLGALAPGYAVDRAVEALQAVGVRSALVEQGGEVRCFGRGPGGRPWRTGIRHPRMAEVIETIERDGGAIATSGDYEKYFEIDGRRQSHILDPRTGLPAAGGVASATVIHPTSCLLADALATAFSVLGEEGTQEFLGKADGGLGLDRAEVILYLVDGVGLRRVTLRTPGKAEGTR